MVEAGRARDPLEAGGFDGRYLLLALVPIGVYGLLTLALPWVRPAGIEFALAEGGNSLEQRALEAHYRYLWISAFLLSSAASLAVGVSCTLAIRAEAPRRARRRIFTLAIAALAAIVVAERLGTPWYTLMGQAEGHDDALYVALFGPSASQATPPLLWMLDAGLFVVKALGAFALVAITTALILTLANLPPPGPADTRARHLAHALGRQRAYLRQATVVYVLALVAMLSWMYWPLPFLAGEGEVAAYRQLLIGAAVLQGVGYSIGLAAIYLPPALLLHRRVVDLAHPTRDQAADELLATNGLATEPLEQVRQAAALLLPALVSALPTLRELWP